MDEITRTKALWAFSMTHERIMERLIRKGTFTQEQGDKILDMLIDGLSEQSIENYSKSVGFKNMINSLVNPQLSNGKFISLTDLAREENRNNPSYVIQSWLRSRNTIEFLRLWERENNPDFKEAECDQLFEQLKKPSYTLTIKKWITQTNAKGITSKQGNNGGTMAHRDIALDFQLWLWPEKRYEIVKVISEEMEFDEFKN